VLPEQPAVALRRKGRAGLLRHRADPDPSLAGAIEPHRSGPEAVPPRSPDPAELSRHPRAGGFPEPEGPPRPLGKSVSVRSPSVRLPDPGLQPFGGSRRRRVPSEPVRGDGTAGHRGRDAAEPEAEVVEADPLDSPLPQS